ncbi:DNA-binding response regulator, OmpR family, contains REC and winged-helix (wHTH) domain [Cryptosporangium aurantiacum]|uniref:DNA-binding response regulator, OmpR family, contains REC and winged-helix (WHTH) domain n=1 Tax=Cryptosporangium aurantiacum TaxID=134849 RepID=A0A1M7ITQ6_9ACTN|nr:DNA-binding response regulator, OmpR family, contains REC and winged-helix (wHTH) domain [Cryptosporangium aurantiacum]
MVEDEQTIAESIATRLRAEGFSVELAGDGPAAVAAFTARPHDLVVLDIMLPGYDGLEVCRRLQAERAVPVLMLTARDAETDVLVGLAVGADDYLTKPFSMRELVARTHALLRRVDRAAELAALDAEPVGADRLTVDDVEISLAERRVRVDGDEVHLTRTEFDLLVCLASRPRAVLPRDRLLTAVWGWSDGSGSRTVDSHIKALRRKLGGDRIRTVHGVGYAWETSR